MESSSRNPGFYFWLAVLLCIGYFFIFIFPNFAASENIQMIAVFEPDEAVPLPYVFDMIAPADTVKQALINFAFYEYYFYGFPYFAVSALSVLTLAPFDLLGNTSVVMVVLRQVISVLPMLLAILLLVYIQTKFGSYRSLVLLLLLLGIPAVVQNNFWWHPDSLAILFAMLVIFFLNKDGLRFGSDFYWSAVFCGFSAGTKGIGFYFFLSIFVYLILGFFSKKMPFKKLIFSGVGFLLFMGVAYLFANPILVYRGVRNDYFRVMREQSVLLTLGYQVFYAKGLSVALPILKEYYGSILFLITALSACVIGIMNDRTRLLNAIILAWALPISVQVFWITHFKFQYWLPVALPLFSTVVNCLPEKMDSSSVFMNRSFNMQWRFWVGMIVSVVVVVQLVAFVRSDVNRYVNRLNRADASFSIQFYETIRRELKPLDAEEIFVYHDVRMYVPSTPGWKTESAFQLLDYDYITSRNFDVLLLMQQRIYDYIQPNADGIDPEQFAQSQVFYNDANDGAIKGYHLIFRDHFGLVFVRDDLFQRSFEDQ